MEQTIESRKLNLISQIILTNDLEIIAAIEYILSVQTNSIFQNISIREAEMLHSHEQDSAQLQDNSHQNELTEELVEHLEQRISHHNLNKESSQDAFDALTDIAKKNGYEL
jgi:hypothetical protein